MQVLDHTVHPSNINKINTGYGEDYYYYKRLKKKKNKKVRVIHSPSGKLKDLQKEFSEWFYEINEELFQKSNFITGFIPGKSIKDNASPHLDKDWVINLDIKDFFPSVNRKMGETIFDTLPRSKNPIYWFTKNKPIAFKRMYLKDFLNTMFIGKGADWFLPQGSPASPLLANYAAIEEIDNRALSRMAIWTSNLNLEQVAYTRYADDITISFNYPLPGGRKAALLLANQIKLAIEKGPFKVKEAKTVVKHKSQRQLVTGIVVNGEETRINRKTINNIRAGIHNAKKNNTELDKETLGMLSFIQSVNKAQYDKLIKQTGENVCK